MDAGRAEEPAGLSKGPGASPGQELGDLPDSLGSKREPGARRLVHFLKRSEDLKLHW